MTVTDDIKNKLDLVDLVTASGVQLRKAGRNWTGFCPFHPNTRTPAFFVFTDTQSYYCFGCHVSGDAFNYVMARQGLDFAGALEQLAARTGVQLQRRTPEQATEDSREATLRQINEDAAVYWSHLLRNTQRGERGRQYAEERGLDKDALETWQLGYAPEEWSNLLVYLTDRKNHAPEEIEAAGLVIRREGGGYYDRFRNRLMFPIRNHKGVIVGFGGRTLGEDHAKYMNTPETPLFHKSSILYGFHEGREAIRKEDQVVLVEGYLDVITAHQAGFKNVVAPMGTALTSDQVGLIKKVTRRIVLALDADRAGQLAAGKGLDVLKVVDLSDAEDTPVPTSQGVVRFERVLQGEFRVAVLPSGKDPDDVIRNDPNEWIKLTSKPPLFLDFYFETNTSDLVLSEAKGRTTAIERLVPAIVELKTFSGENTNVEQEHYIQKLAQLVGLPDTVVRAEVVRVQRRKAVTPNPQLEITLPQNTFTREDELLSLILRYPQIRVGVETTLRGELPRFPQLKDVVRGDVREVLRRTENKLIWDLWNERPPENQVATLPWAEGLSPALRSHAILLVQWRDEPPLEAYRAHIQAGQIAETIALELRKTVVQQRRQHVKAMYESVEEPADERQKLLDQLIALNEYQSVVTAPRRSTYFLDLGSRLEQLG